MSSTKLQQMKRTFIHNVKRSQMLMLQYADACRDEGDTEEYEKAKAAYENLDRVMLG